VKSEISFDNMHNLLRRRGASWGARKAKTFEPFLYDRTQMLLV